MALLTVAQTSRNCTTFLGFKKEQIVNFSTRLVGAVAVLFCGLTLSPTASREANYSLKVNYSPLFPGIQRAALGELPFYGEVVGVWRHTVRHSFFYLYDVRGRKLDSISNPLLLPPGSSPSFCFADNSVWIGLGRQSVGRLCLRHRMLNVTCRFTTGRNMQSLVNLNGNLLMALEDKPGWYRFYLFSRGGKVLWADSKSWNGRAFGFAERKGTLWVSVDNWDGISSTLLRYTITHLFGDNMKLAFASAYTTSAFDKGKILISGQGSLNNEPVALGTVWRLGFDGVRRSNAFFLLGPREFKKIPSALPFSNQELDSALVLHNGMDLLLQYDPNKEMIAPMALSIFHVGEKFYISGESEPKTNPREALQFFMSKNAYVGKIVGKEKFNALKFKAILVPRQWLAWRQHVAETGHDGISGNADTDYPFAHSWKAIADSNPKHTVWACQAKPEDYLAGRVKGTDWSYIPFDADLRQPVCERCHPIRPGKPSHWSMYTVTLKGNQLTPDGMRAPDQ